MTQLERFTNGLRLVMQKAKAGAYSGDRGRKLEAYSLLGGEVWFWVKRAVKAQNTRLAASLFVEGFGMIAVATARRVATRILGVRKAEVIPPLRSGAGDVQTS